MNYSCRLLGLGALFLAGCGSSDDSGGLSQSEASSFLGIYQATSHTENATGCDTPGMSLLETESDKYFVITTSVVFGVRIVVLTSCSGVSACQSKAADEESGALYQFDYSYTLSSSVNATTLAGLEASTGFGNGTMCTQRTYADHLLNLNPDHSVHLESRTKDLADQPEQDNTCSVEPAQSKAEAAKLPCADLQELDGTFVQAL